MFFKRKIGPKYKKYLAELGRKRGSITAPETTGHQEESGNILFKYSLIFSGNIEIKKLHSTNLCSHC